IPQAKNALQNVIFPFLLGEVFREGRKILIRHLNPTIIRQPEQVAAPPTLGEHGEGLTSILFNWYTQNGKLPDRVEYVLRELFPNWSLSFTVTPDGRVM